MSLGKKKLWIILISANALILSLNLMLSQVCFYLDKLSGEYFTNSLQYLYTPILVLWVISVVVEILILVRAEK